MVVSNLIFMKSGIKVPANRLLVLSPHCLQLSTCPHKITRDPNNCKKGGCNVATLIDLFKDIYSLTKRYSFTSTDIHVLFILMGEWNENGRTSETFISKQAVQTLTSLPETTMRRTLQRLSSFRIISLERCRGQVLIKFRPQAVPAIAGERMAKERRSSDVKPFASNRRAHASQSPREEPVRVEEGSAPVSLAQIMEERRRVKGVKERIPSRP